jgi:SAM-dependent methyltransferase
MDREALEHAVERAYSAAAESPRARHPFPVGEGFAREAGYGEELLASIPAAAIEAFAGVSNVAVQAPIAAGDRVLDLGCGAGLDSIAAARRAGAGGVVAGLDFSRAMLERARAAAAEARAGNVHFVLGSAALLPLPGAWADAALVNGIFNLNPNRAAIFAELARVVRPGGVVCGAELILTAPLPDTERGSPSSWFA